MGRGVLALLAAVAEDERAACANEGGHEGSEAAWKARRPSPCGDARKDGYGRGVYFLRNYGRGTVARVIGVAPATLRRALNAKISITQRP